MKRLFYFLAMLSVSVTANAQMRQLNAAEIAAGLQKLAVQGSVLYIAAHPDDENTRLLAYLAKEVKVRTGYLSLTRGDGGQNLIGNEQAELLGLIRTQELLAARRTDGAEQFFTRANDFGFSKTAEESFKIWGKEQILADAVWVIRKFRPDVIITRFPEDARAGHGHHAGSAIIAREAFVAAADPKRFPDQLKYLSVWQAKRILWNTFNFGGNNTTAPDQLKINVGLYNPLLGKSYGEIAAISRTNHKSQGFGSTLQRGEAYEFFTPVAGEKVQHSLFDGIDLNLKDEQIQSAIKEIKNNFNVNAPSTSLNSLLTLRKLTKGKNFNHSLLDQLILSCAGLFVDVYAKESGYAAGDTIPTTVDIISRLPENSPITVSYALSNDFVKLSPNKLSNNILSKQTTTSSITQPYWLTKAHPIGQYILSNQEEVGHPENPNPLQIAVKLKIDDEIFELSLPINYKFTDPAKGEKYQPLVIAPPVTATLNEKSYIFTSNAPKSIAIQLKSFRNNSVGFITPQLPSGWISNPTKIEFNLPKKGDEQTVYFNITPSTETLDGNLILQANINGKITDKGLKTIAYEHIPTITIFPQAAARLAKINLKIVGKKIGYIDGAGDLTAEALQQIGYEITHLTPAQVISSDLSAFDAIVTGIRLYNISDDIKFMQPKLLAYVEKGGTLLVQYNVNNNLKIQNLGPYPFRLSTKRVTEEDAKVNFLAPNHQALNYPNKITDRDFEGWVQERGLYFGTELDPKYTPILSMNDIGETAADGSLFVADYGKGKFVYTSLVFFRELPAGVTGAYRLFANLIAPKKQ
jgi:LmbE family N-acetylglucosaminyl deacetylase